MGKLAEIKTKENEASVESFINTLPEESKRKDSFQLLDLMKKSHQGSTQNVGQQHHRVWQLPI